MERRGGSGSRSGPHEDTRTSQKGRDGETKRGEAKHSAKPRYRNPGSFEFKISVRKGVAKFFRSCTVRVVWTPAAAAPSLLEARQLGDSETLRL